MSTVLANPTVLAAVFGTIVGVLGSVGAGLVTKSHSELRAARVAARPLMEELMANYGTVEHALRSRSLIPLSHLRSAEWTSRRDVLNARVMDDD